MVVDRIVVREGLETRLADSFRTALDPGRRHRHSGNRAARGRARSGSPSARNFACPVSGFTIPEIEPRLFSFNAPFGACPACDGLGVELFFDERLVVPDVTLKLTDGRAGALEQGQVALFHPDHRRAGEALRFRCDAKPWKDLPEKVQKLFLYGSGDEEIKFRFDEGGRVYEVTRTFEGVIPNMERRYRETDSAWIREEFERYQNNRPCGACDGYRLRPRRWR